MYTIRKFVSATREIVFYNYCTYTILLFNVKIYLLYYSFYFLISYITVNKWWKEYLIFLKSEDAFQLVSMRAEQNYCWFQFCNTILLTMLLTTSSVCNCGQTNEGSFLVNTSNAFGRARIEARKTKSLRRTLIF